MRAFALFVVALIAVSEYAAVVRAIDAARRVRKLKRVRVLAASDTETATETATDVAGMAVVMTDAAAHTIVEAEAVGEAETESAAAAEARVDVSAALQLDAESAAEAGQRAYLSQERVSSEAMAQIMAGVQAELESAAVAQVQVHAGASVPVSLSIGGVNQPGIVAGNVVIANYAPAAGADCAVVRFAVTNTGGTQVDWRTATVAANAWQNIWTPNQVGKWGWPIFHGAPDVHQWRWNIPFGATTAFDIRFIHDGTTSQRTVTITRPAATAADVCSALHAEYPTHTGTSTAEMNALATAAVRRLGDNSAGTTRLVCRQKAVSAWIGRFYANAACSDARITLALASAVRSTAAAVDNRPAKMFALEEELIFTTLTRGGQNPAEKNELSRSGMAVAAPQVPVFKLTIDHDSGAVVEAVVSPLATGADGTSLAVMRNVIDRFDAAIPAHPTGPIPLQTAITTFNHDVANNNPQRPTYRLADLPVDQQLNGQSVMLVGHRLRGTRNDNNVQVNFDLSLSGLTKYQELGALFATPHGASCFIAAAVAAERYVAAQFGAGAPANLLTALPAQQQHELKGLFIVWFYQMMGRSIYDDKQNGVNHDVPDFQNNAKNFYELMIKTNVYHLVTELPFPLSLTISEWYRTAVAPHALAVATDMVGRLRTALQTRAAPWPRNYAGNSVTGQAPYLNPATWAPYLAHFNAAGARPGLSTTQYGVAWDAATPAFRVRSHAGTGFHDETMIVIEQRFQWSNFNVGFTRTHTGPQPDNVNVNPDTSLGQLRAVQDSYAAGTEFTDWYAAC